MVPGEKLNGVSGYGLVVKILKGSGVPYGTRVFVECVGQILKNCWEYMSSVFVHGYKEI